MARFRSRSPARGPKRSRIANADEVTKEEWRTDAPCSTCPKQTGTYSGWDEYGVTKFYCRDCWRKYLHEKAVEEIMEAMPELSLGDDDADDEVGINTQTHDTPSGRYNAFSCATSSSILLPPDPQLLGQGTVRRKSMAPPQEQLPCVPESGEL